MAWRLTTTGGEGDCRSESEVSSCTDHEDKKQKWPLPPSHML